MATKQDSTTRQTLEDQSQNPDTGVPDPGPDPWPEGHTPSEVAEEQRLKAEKNRDKTERERQDREREANEASQPSHRTAQGQQQVRTSNVAAADLSGKE
jgi:hypothetical protein